MKVLKLNNLITRTLAGAVFILLIVGSLLLGNVTFGILCLIVIIFSLDEFFKLMKRLKMNDDVLPAVSMASASFISLMLFMNELTGPQFLSIIFLFFLIMMIIQMSKNQRNPIMNSAINIFSLVYLFIPFACLYLIGFFNNYVWTNTFSHEILLCFFILNWVSDTGAYLVGSAFGKHKLMERISPKKTIEGSLGAIVTTIIASYLLSMFYDQVSLLDWIVIAILIVTFGTLGDLFQSLLKRKAEVKDSGNLIPGHGGIMDRFDSVYFSAPVVFVYLNMVSA